MKSSRRASGTCRAESCAIAVPAVEAESSELSSHRNAGRAAGHFPSDVVRRLWASVEKLGDLIVVITHNRKFFYKYVKGNDALSILDDSRVKWSHPRIFNDPFDVQADIRFPFSTDELTGRVAHVFEETIFSPVEPSGDDSSVILALVREIRRSDSTPPRGSFNAWARDN